MLCVHKCCVHQAAPVMQGGGVALKTLSQLTRLLMLVCEKGCAGKKTVLRQTAIKAVRGHQRGPTHAAIEPAGGEGDA